LDLKARPETHARWLADGLRHQVEVPITGAAKFVKAVVSDAASRRVGSTVLTLK
jgi:hypothetical protein